MSGPALSHGNLNLASRWDTGLAPGDGWRTDRSLPTSLSRIASHIALGKPWSDSFHEWKIEFGPARTDRPAEALVQRRPTGWL